MLERLAELMHEEWLTLMAERGHHLTESCPHRPKTGKFAWSNCTNCHAGMVPWAELPEEVKEVNRRGVLAFFKALGVEREQAERMQPGSLGRAVQELQSECDRCEVKSLCSTCSGGQALYALGVIVPSQRIGQEAEDER